MAKCEHEWIKLFNDGKIDVCTKCRSLKDTTDGHTWRVEPETWKYYEENKRKHWWEFWKTL